MLGLAARCSPPTTVMCLPGPMPPPAPARIVPAGQIAPFPLELPVSLCNLAEDSLSVVATLRGAPPGATVSVSDVRLRASERRVSMTVDVGTLPAGSYLLQVIVDPAVASTTVPLLVAADRMAEPTERRLLATPCRTPLVTTSGTLICAELGVGRGWRVERPGGVPVRWPETLEVATVGDVVWVIDQAADASVEVRRLVEVDGGLAVTHVQPLQRPEFSFVAVSRQKAVGAGWQFMATPDASVLTLESNNLSASSPKVVADDTSVIALDVSVQAPWCDVSTSACFPSPVSGAELVAATPTVAWLSGSPLVGPATLFPLPTRQPFQLSAVSRPLGPDAGVVFSVLVPGDVRPFAPSDGVWVPGALIFTADAGLFAGRLGPQGFSLERLPAVRPVTVTSDWLVSQSTDTSVELNRLTP
ncbi:MAG: hypothetical protein SFW67_10870 [Myxococcaceae bacterium]|nr:hypothetical protein [Myxococcaceae bacterium]